MNPVQEFNDEKANRIAGYPKQIALQEAAKQFMNKTIDAQYSYNFTWLGVPIIQYPQDIAAIQEIIWTVKPDLIIETGIAHGGSIVLSASMLELIGDEGLVLGLDIDIRPHNRKLIEAHPMSKRIKMLEGSSIDEAVVKQVHELAKGKKRILVILDSNHTHDHVLAELKAYAPLVTLGSYCLVFDTIVEDLPVGTYANRSWDIGNNPKTAVWEYLKENDNFVVDNALEDKLLVTVAPNGYLKRVK